MTCRKGSANAKFPYNLHLGIQVIPSFFITLFDCLLEFSKTFAFLKSLAYTNQFLSSFLTLMSFWGDVVQCYDAKFLAIYASMPSSPLQLEEDLEQIKVLENGYKMKVKTSQ